MDVADYLIFGSVTLTTEYMISSAISELKEPLYRIYKQLKRQNKNYEKVNKLEQIEND